MGQDKPRTSGGIAARLPPEVWGWIALGLGLFVTASTITMMILAYDPAPLADQWDNLIAGRDITFEWLIAQHNEHRLLFPRLVFILDHALSRETNVVDLVVNVLLVTTTFAMLVHLVRRSGGLSSKAEALWSLGLLLGCLFSAMQADNFTWGFQVQFFGVCTLAVASLMVLTLAPPTRGSLAAVILLEAIGLYTLSSGILILVLTIGVALWLDRPRSHIGLLILAAVILIASYLWGYETPAAHADPLRGIAHAGTILFYALTELGLPIWSLLFLHSPSASHIFGVLGLCLFLYFLVTAWSRRKTAPAVEAAWLGIAAFAVSVTALTALGRSSFGIAQALSGRYTTPMILFWIAMAMLSARDVKRRGDRARRRMVFAGGIVLLVMVAANQPLSIARAIHLDVMRRAAVPALLAGVGDTTMLERLYPSPEGALEHIDDLKQDRASLFTAPWTHWLGGPMPAMSASEVVPACAGRIDDVTPVTDADHPGWRVLGRLDDASPDLSDHMVFLDRDRTVVGYGFARLTPEAVSQPKTSWPQPRDRWIGELKAADLSSTFAYVLRKDDRIGCRFGPLILAR